MPSTDNAIASDALFDLLEEVSATTSTKTKGELLRGLDSDQQRVVLLALDPRTTFGIEKLPAYPEGPANTQWGDAEFELLDRLARRKLTGNAALEEIGWALRELTPKSAELFKRVLRKDLRGGIGAKLVNKVHPGLVPVYPYMRCSLPKSSNMAKWDWPSGVYSQLKADGMFANVSVGYDGSVEVTSRQGAMFPAGALGSLEESLANVTAGYQLHGELVVYLDNKLLQREVGNGVLNHLAGGGWLEPGQFVKFLAWDCVPLAAAVSGGKHEVPYADRYARLCELAAGFGLIEVIETRLVRSYAEAMEHYRGVLQRGMEGTVVKHSAAIWRDGDSKDQVKFKLEVDVDLKIVGYRDGTPGTRTEKTFGAVVCRTADDLLEVGVHGFSREVEADIHERREELIGKVMTVRANAVMAPSGEQQIHSLFLPRFVEIRATGDKAEADTLARVQAQFEAAIA